MIRVHMSSNSNDDSHDGIGCGVFLLVAGLILLAKELRLIPYNTDWLWPAILIAWGCGILYKALSKKR